MATTRDDTLTLVQFAPALGVRNASPFCLKTEALLVSSGQPYVTENWADPRKAPKGKLPLLRHRGQLIADSTFIRRYLESTFAIDFDEGLSEAERGVADAFVKFCEEHLYFILFYSRWMEEANWPVLRDAYFGAIPALLRPLITSQIRKQSFNVMKGQGLGRHSREELYALGAADLRSIAGFLGDKPFFMGERATSADATVYAWLSSILDTSLASPLQDAARAHATLVSYTARLGQHYFG